MKDFNIELYSHLDDLVYTIGSQEIDTLEVAKVFMVSEAVVKEYLQKILESL